ncbi:MAG: recombination regulator RecX [Treponema sp.]|nr:recombination regulator RecX [Treponema sp.]
MTTIISIKTGTDEELKRIELSDGSLFSFRTSYLPSAFIDEAYIPGGEISAEDAGSFRFAAACLRAEKAALRLVARAEQTAFGLFRKLERRGFETAHVRVVLGRLADLNILNDRRYAQMWVQARLALRTETPRHLLAGLCGRGIDRDDAQSALKAALTIEAESALLRRFIEKKHPLPPHSDESSGFSRQLAEAARSLKYLLKNEGFSSSVIQLYWEENEL